MHWGHIWGIRIINTRYIYCITCSYMNSSSPSREPQSKSYATFPALSIPCRSGILCPVNGNCGAFLCLKYPSGVVSDENSFWVKRYEDVLVCIFLCLDLPRTRGISRRTAIRDGVPADWDTIIEWRCSSWYRCHWLVLGLDVSYAFAASRRSWCLVGKA